MRLFNLLVMDTNINGTSPVVTADSFAEPMGRADEATFEIEVEVAAGTAPTITVELYHSNSGKGYVAPASNTLVSAASLGSLPYRTIVKYNAETLGGLVQLKVTLGGTTPVARVRIWSCGRGQK